MIKKFFIGAVSKREPNYEKVKKLIDDLPHDKIAICYSNQFINVAKKISEATEKKVVSMIQVLGCSRPVFSEEIEAIVIIGQGKFHSVSLAYETKLPTYILEGETLSKIEGEDLDKMEKKERGVLMKYLISDNIGVLITTKPGQMRFDKAIEYKRKLKEKKGYVFISNSVDVGEFENFGIDCWVNTACPRMDLDEGSLINLDKIPEELIK